MPRLREELMVHSEEEGERFYLIWVWGGQGATESKRQAERAEQAQTGG